DCIRADGVDRSRRGQDPQARKESGELTVNETTVTTPNELEIRVERVFDAPRAHVFSVWTDPQLIPEWWGDGTVVEEMDVRAGGYEGHGGERQPTNGRSGCSDDASGSRQKRWPRRSHARCSLGWGAGAAHRAAGARRR